MSKNLYVNVYVIKAKKLKDSQNFYALDIVPLSLYVSQGQEVIDQNSQLWELVSRASKNDCRIWAKQVKTVKRNYSATELFP